MMMFHVCCRRYDNLSNLSWELRLFSVTLSTNQRPVLAGSINQKPLLGRLVISEGKS